MGIIITTCCHCRLEAKDIKIPLLPRLPLTLRCSRGNLSTRASPVAILLTGRSAPASTPTVRCSPDFQISSFRTPCRRTVGARFPVKEDELSKASTTSSTQGPQVPKSIHRGSESLLTTSKMSSHMAIIIIPCRLEVPSGRTLRSRGATITRVMGRPASS